MIDDATIVALATLQTIIPVAAAQRIEPRASRESIIAEPAFDHIIIGAPIGVVPSPSAVDRILSRATS